MPIYELTDPADYFRANDGLTKGDPKWKVSRSDLLPFLNATPRHWIEDTGILDSRSIRLGSLVDCLVLTPELFSVYYAIQPSTYTADGGKGKPPVEKPWNNNATVCKDWNAEQEGEGKTVVSRSELDDARQMADAVLEKKVVSWGGTVGDLVSLSSTQTMVVADYTEPTTGITVPLRALIDVTPPDEISPDSLWDLKTTRDTDPEKWRRSVSNFDYEFQAAFYLWVYNRATGSERDKFGHLIVGNSAPHLAAVRQLSTESIEIGERKFEAAIRNYCQCLKSGEWPAYSDDVEIVEPMPWDASKWDVV